MDEIMKEYIELNGIAGQTIEECVNRLLRFKEIGEFASANFNGKMLYSDTVTMNDAYLEITGKTKEEFDNDRKRELDEYEKKKKEHIDRIPELTKEWISKGREILPEDKWEDWERCVPIRLRDLYHGMELDSCLKIIKLLNENDSFEAAKKEIESQGHSGMSFSLVCSMLISFHDKGKEFVEYVR